MDGDPPGIAMMRKIEEGCTTAGLDGDPPVVAIMRKIEEGCTTGRLGW